MVSVGSVSQHHSATRLFTDYLKDTIRFEVSSEGPLSLLISNEGSSSLPIPEGEWSADRMTFCLQVEKVSVVRDFISLCTSSEI